MSAVRQIIIAGYSLAWPQAFEELRSIYTKALVDLAVDIQHVGSTAVPGLAAKPVIDIDIIIPDKTLLQAVTARLAAIGYQHLGEMGIPGRHAFKRSAGTQPHLPAHHLYVCLRGSAALRNHLTLRDHLRSHPADAQHYGDLKKELAAKYPEDIDSYIRCKTPFILDILRHYEFDTLALDLIRQANGMI